MPAFLGTLGTCFMILATPSQPDRAPLILTGYSDIAVAREAAADIDNMFSDAARRNATAEYRLTPAYQEEIARAAKESAEQKAKCAANPKAIGCPDGPVSMFSTNWSAGGHAKIWDAVQVIAAPDVDCRKDAR